VKFPNENRALGIAKAEAFLPAEFQRIRLAQLGQATIVLPERSWKGFVGLFRSAPRGAMNPAIEKLRVKVWPVIIDLWIAGVLVLFFWLRVAGSSTGKHLLKLLGKH
jgi:hypothetical protein